MTLLFLFGAFFKELHDAHILNIKMLRNNKWHKVIKKKKKKSAPGLRSGR